MAAITPGPDVLVVDRVALAVDHGGVDERSRHAFEVEVLVDIACAADPNAAFRVGLAGASVQVAGIGADPCLVEIRCRGIIDGDAMDLDADMDVFDDE